MHGARRPETQSIKLAPKTVALDEFLEHGQLQLLLVRADEMQVYSQSSKPTLLTLRMRNRGQPTDSNYKNDKGHPKVPQIHGIDAFVIASSVRLPGGSLTSPIAGTDHLQHLHFSTRAET